MLIDVHCHLDHPWYDKDRDQVIERAIKSGVKAIITNGIDYDTNRKALELAKKYDIVKAALGIYPIEPLRHEIFEDDVKIKQTKFDVDEEIDFIKKNKKNIVAIGEVGLDCNKPEFKEPKILNPQKELFQKMIELAEKLKLPIEVHSRKAEALVIEMLESSKLKNIIMHCFCGKKKLAKKIADNGWYFSIPTAIVRGHQFQMIVEQTHLSQILTETDGPYQSPFPQTRNEPANIIEAIKKIAEIKNITVDDCKKNIFMNYQKMFQ